MKVVILAGAFLVSSLARGGDLRLRCQGVEGHGAQARSYRAQVTTTAGDFATVTLQGRETRPELSLSLEVIRLDANLLTADRTGDWDGDVILDDVFGPVLARLVLRRNPVTSLWGGQFWIKRRRFVLSGCR